MNYETIMKKDDYALIIREGKLHKKGDHSLAEYAVVYGIDEKTGTWTSTVGYWNFGQFGMSQLEALSEALDFFRYKTESDYVTKTRIEVLASLFKDKLIQDDEESACYYFRDTCNMSEEEMRFFGFKIEWDEEEE